MARPLRVEYPGAYLGETPVRTYSMYSDLGDYFGGVSGAAITVRYNKVVKEMAGDKKLKRKAGKIKARIINI